MKRILFGFGAVLSTSVLAGPFGDGPTSQPSSQPSASPTTRALVDVAAQPVRPAGIDPRLSLLAAQASEKRDDAAVPLRKAVAAANAKLDRVRSSVVQKNYRGAETGAEDGYHRGDTGVYYSSDARERAYKAAKADVVTAEKALKDFLAQPLDAFLPELDEQNLRVGNIGRLLRRGSVERVLGPSEMLISLDGFRIFFSGVDSSTYADGARIALDLVEITGTRVFNGRTIYVAQPFKLNRAPAGNPSPDDKIRRGMTRSEIVASLGEAAASTLDADGHELATWTIVDARGTTSYDVELLDGKVTTFKITKRAAAGTSQPPAGRGAGSPAPAPAAPARPHAGTRLFPND
jgi:hypothetical protein